MAVQEKRTDLPLVKTSESRGITSGSQDQKGGKNGYLLLDFCYGIADCRKECTSNLFF